MAAYVKWKKIWSLTDWNKIIWWEVNLIKKGIHTHSSGVGK